MLKNYFKIAIRNLVKDKSYSLINIMGLAFGITSCLLIFLYVQHELSYDEYHEKSDRIYRLAQEAKFEKGFAWVGSGVARKLKSYFAEVEEVVRIHRNRSLVSYIDKNRGVNKSFRETGFVFADPGLFDVFTIPLAQGDSKFVLDEPGEVAISESAAKKYFGDENPIGKSLTLENQVPMTVSGVFRDIPNNSHFNFDLIASYGTLKQYYGIPVNNSFTSFWWPITWHYVLLKEGASAQQIQQNLPDFAKRHRDADEVELYNFVLQPITDIYLHSDLSGEVQAGGSITNIYVFSAIAIIILVIACINFMNLSTARSAKRSREVGVRKTLGAQKNQLIWQFLGESVILSLIAVAISVILIELLMPLFNNLAGKTIVIDYLSNQGLWLGVLTLILVTGLIAGVYPAFFLSGFKPSRVLKGDAHSDAKGGTLRKGLVVFQFAISIILIVGTLITYSQLNYMQNASLGFDKEETVVISADNVQSQYELIKEHLLQQSGVLSVTGSNVRPGFGHGWGPSYVIEGLQPGENYTINYQNVDYNFFDQFGIDIIAGRNFSQEYATEAGIPELREERRQLYSYTEKSFIVNEAALQEFGWTRESAIGKEIELFTEENGTRFLDVKGRVAGVVENYHAASLHDRIEPIIYDIAKRADFNQDGNHYYNIGSFFVKLAPGNAQQIMEQLEASWKEVVPGRPFVASFLDQDLQNLYRADLQVSKIITSFAILAIAIACLGLFGLSSFMAEQRTKEIGVRKVMGATVRSIVGLLAKDFMKLVMIGLVIAIPVAWYLMSSWLENFAYKITMSPVYFLYGGLLALAIALLTISWQSIKAALMNPVKSLRSE